MKKIAGLLVFAFLFFYLLTIASAQSSGNRTQVFPRIEGDPKALEFHLMGGSGYTWIQLAEISLWASGAAASPGLEEIQRIARAINSSPELPGSGREKAEFILEYMHKNLLRSYSQHQTRIDTILSGGMFNCVSSSVLYMILCKSAGLDVTGAITKDHALAELHIDGETIDVETTNRYGFDPGNRREFHDQFGRLTGFTYVPARNYRDREAVKSIELVSLILWNRISQLEAANRFAEAVTVAVDRAILLNGETAAGGADIAPQRNIFHDPQRTLVDRIFNYGASLLRAGREEDSLAWAAYASRAYGDENRWQEFIFAAANNRLNKFVRAGQTENARAFLDSQKTMLSPANYAQLNIILVDTELLNAAERISSAREGDLVLAAIEEATANESINARRARELYNFAILKTASILSAAPGRDWLSAINYIEKSAARYGSSREMEQAVQTYKNNRAADFHNRFAAAWNGGNHDEARRILNEGLAEFPNDRRLLTNRETINRRQ